MNKSEEFQAAILKEYPHLKIDVDPPAKPDGVTWLALAGIEPRIEVECKEGRGFGIHVMFPNDPNSSVPFAGPDAIFTEASLAVRFIRSIWEKIHRPLKSGEKWILTQAANEAWLVSYGKYSVHLNSVWDIDFVHPPMTILEEGLDNSESEKLRLEQIKEDLLIVEAVMSS
jgi:hypothetical protein